MYRCHQFQAAQLLTDLHVAAIVTGQVTSAALKVIEAFEPVSSKVNHLRGTRFEEKRKQRF